MGADSVTIGRAELRAVLEEIFEERSRIDSAAHGEHHQWIQERIEAEKAKKEMYREVAKSAIGWSVPVILYGVYYWIRYGHWPVG